MGLGREDKPHIGIYGRCNSGKSTLFNMLTGGNFALVSEHAGTTTDPVRRSCEILDFAPVIFIDTAGLDDVSALGRERMEKTLRTLAQIDLAVLVFSEWGEAEGAILFEFERYAVPFVLVHNIFPGCEDCHVPKSFSDTPMLTVNLLSAADSARDELFGIIKRLLPENSYRVPSMFDCVDLCLGGIGEGDVVLLVCPIDSEAPSGRLILPQVKAIRDLLDRRAVTVVVQPSEVSDVLAAGLRPRLVVTDSQAFAEVREVVADFGVEVEITSFSILMARVKGDMRLYNEGLGYVGKLKSADRVLILENCLHQTSCDDIARVKIPRLLQKYCDCALDFTVVYGLSALPDDLDDYAMAVQCGGCMVTGSQLKNRIRAVSSAGVPITNYGMLLSLITR